MSKKLTPIAATMLVAFSSPLMAPLAQAQTSPAETPGNLPQVTVRERATASDIKVDQSASVKMTAPILDTPKSMTIIPVQVISQTGSSSLSEALRTTPGITFAAGEGGTPIGDRPLIRGFEAQSSTAVDGVRDVGSQSRDMFNLDAIEVTRGADSTTSGRGGAGGSINLISKMPKKESFSEGSIGLGSAQYKRLVADGNYLFGDNAAIRLNGMFTDTGTAGRPHVTSQSWGFAPSVRFGLDGPTAVTLSYYHLQADDMPDYSTPYQNSLTRSKANPDGPVNAGRQFYGLNGRDFRRTQADIGTLQVQHDFGNALMVRNTTRYGKTGNDYIVTNPDDSFGNVRNGLVYRSPKSRIAGTTTFVNQTDLSGEFVTGDIRHKFVTGVELGQERSRIGGYTVFPNAAFTSRVCGAAGGPAPGSYNCTGLFNPNADDPWRGRIVESPNVTSTRVDTKAIYVLDTVTLNQQWLLNLGLRYDSYDASARTPAFTRIAPTGNGLGANAAGTRVAATAFSNQSSFWNYQAGLVYKVVPEASVYVSWATASSPPGALAGDGGDNLTGGNQALSPERTRTVEIGAKWEVLNKTLALTAAIFRSEKNNARINLDANTQIVAGKQKVDGLELGITGNLSKKWTVFGGYSYMNSKLVDNGSWSGAAANNGNQFPNTPTHSFSLWSTCEVLPKLTAGGGVFYMSRIYGNPANSVFAPAYTRFDAMASYALNKQVSLRLNVQNLTDKTYYDKALGGHYAHMAPGRSVMLSADLRY